MKNEELMKEELMKEELRKQLLAIMPPVFVRQQARGLTGGMLDGRTLANLDCKGQGPSAAKVSMGKVKVGYLREPFIDWFLNRLSAQG